MRKLLILVGVLAGVLTVRGQVVQDWLRMWNGPVDWFDTGAAITLSYDNIIVVGQTYCELTQYDGLLLKYNSNGDLIWSMIDSRPSNGSLYLAKTGSDGNIYVSGWADSTGQSSNTITQKYDSSGALIWSHMFDSPDHLADVSKDLALSWGLDPVIAGFCNSNGSGSNTPDILAIKYNGVTGTPLWINQFDGPGHNHDEATAVVIDDLGQIYLTGYVDTDSTLTINDDIIILKYSTAGALIWSRTYNGPGNGDDAGVDIAIDLAGNILVAGSSTGLASDVDIIILKYNPQGGLLEEMRYDGFGHNIDKATSILVGPSGDYFIRGSSKRHDYIYGPADIVILKYNPAGDQLWTYKCRSSNYSYGCDRFCQDLAGNIFLMTAPPNPHFATDIGIWSFNPDGDLRWRGVLNIAGYENAYDIVAVDSSIYITGNTQINEYDCVTAKFHQTPVPNAIITAEPISAPIQIPATGGNFSFSVNIINNEADSLLGIAWAAINAPDGYCISPVLGPVVLTLAAGANINRIRTQSIPGTAPPGRYFLRAYLGADTNHVWSSNNFTFEKLLSGSGPIISDWSNTGDPFPGEQPITAFIPSDQILTTSPNPFNPSTTISYQLSAISRVRLLVYDTAGRLVRTLVDESQLAGLHSATFKGEGLSAGVYLVSLQAGEFSATQKVVLLK